MKAKNCIDCGEPCEFMSASGRCPACHKKRLVAVTERKVIHDASQNGEVKNEKRICQSCCVEYDARLLNILGHWMDFSHDVCEDCWRKQETERNAQEQAQRVHETQRKREEGRRTCGIPLKYFEERFTTWEIGRSGNVDRAYSLAIEYATDYPLMKPQGYRSLFLSSPGCVGLGKTHLVCSIAHQVLDRWQGEGRCPVYLITESDLFERIRATYHHQGEHEETEEQIIKKLIWVPLLILDDLGKEEVADPKFVQRTLFKIINGRYNNTLPTVFTANDTPEEIRRHLGGSGGKEASYDRLVEMCKGKFFIMTGESYRRKEK